MRALVDSLTPNRLHRLTAYRRQASRLDSARSACAARPRICRRRAASLSWPKQLCTLGVGWPAAAGSWRFPCDRHRKPVDDNATGPRCGDREYCLRELGSRQPRQLRLDRWSWFWRSIGASEVVCGLPGTLIPPARQLPQHRIAVAPGQIGEITAGSRGPPQSAAGPLQRNGCSLSQNGPQLYGASSARCV